MVLTGRFLNAPRYGLLIAVRPQLLNVDLMSYLIYTLALEFSLPIFSFVDPASNPYDHLVLWAHPLSAFY